MSPWITGTILSLLVGVVILGGIKSIARVCKSLYHSWRCFISSAASSFSSSTSACSRNVSLIVTSAFTPQAAGGGFAGATVMMAARYGIARGLFSNESGLGSAPIVAAAAQTRNPIKQALVSATGTFWDTVVVCALTGLVLVSEIILNPSDLGGLTGAALTRAAFAKIPVIGPVLLTVGLLTFVFSTILGWSYYGERAIEYLLGKRAIRPYRYLWVLGVMVGSVAALPLVWDLADAMNAMMRFQISSHFYCERSLSFRNSTIPLERRSRRPPKPRGISELDTIMNNAGQREHWDRRSASYFAAIGHRSASEISGNPLSCRRERRRRVRSRLPHLHLGSASHQIAEIVIGRHTEKDPVARSR